MRIGIIIEVKKRELPFLSILKRRLELENHEVALISFRHNCLHEIIRFKPEILVVNGLRKMEPYGYKTMYLPKKLFNTKIVCYYSEQLGRADRSIAYTYDNSEILRNVDYHICWGKRFAKDLIGLGVSKNKVYIIGSMQYDISKFYTISRHELKSSLASNYNLDESKSWVLIADNIIKVTDHKGHYDLRRSEFNRLVEKAAVRMPKVEFIFRTHPETSDEENDALRSCFSKYPNIHCINEGHLFYWIHVSKAMIIWVSTSSIQAISESIPVFSYKTSDNLDDVYWQMGMIDLYTDMDKLVLDLEEAVCNEDSFKTSEKVKSFIHDWYYKMDGLSFERFVYLIRKVSNDVFIPWEGKEYPNSYKLKCLYYEFRASLGDLIKGRLGSRYVSGREIALELEKYDVKQFDCKFKEVTTDDGIYVEEI